MICNSCIGTEEKFSLYLVFKHRRGRREGDLSSKVLRVWARTKDFFTPSHYNVDQTPMLRTETISFELKREKGKRWRFFLNVMAYCCNMLEG